MKHQFEMPLEEHVSGKNIFWSTLIGKSRERTKNTSYIALLSYQLISTVDSVHQSWIGCAGWLVAQKDNVGGHFFSFLAFANKSRPKCTFFRDKFLKRHFKLMSHSVLIKITVNEQF